MEKVPFYFKIGGVPIYFKLDKSLAEEFRNKSQQVYGEGKGHLTKSFESALQNYIGTLEIVESIPGHSDLKKEDPYFIQAVSEVVQNTILPEMIESGQYGHLEFNKILKKTGFEEVSFNTYKNILKQPSE